MIKSQPSRKARQQSQIAINQSSKLTSKPRCLSFRPFPSPNRRAARQCPPHKAEPELASATSRTRPMTDAMSYSISENVAATGTWAVAPRHPCSFAKKQTRTRVLQSSRCHRDNTSSSGSEISTAMIRPRLGNISMAANVRTTAAAYCHRRGQLSNIGSSK